MQENIVREELLALLKGKQAHKTFHQVIDNFPTAKINYKHPNLPYTMWHLLEHIRICQTDILEYIKDPNYKWRKFPEEYWPDKTKVVNESEWNQTISQIDNEMKEFIQITQNLSNDLTSSVPSNKKHSIIREILIIADHNAYHLGQMSLLRQLFIDDSK